LGVPDTHTLVVFAAASLAVLAFPGPAVTYIVARSVRHGPRAGITSTIGIETGNLIQVVAATAGLSALLASSATAFTLLRYAGAAYLIYLGLRALLGSESDGAEAAPPAGAKLFRDGVVIAVLNPKTALFFLAFLPQFVDPARGSQTIQVAILGVCFVALACLSDGAYALLAGALGRRLRRPAGSRRILARATGGLYIGLGAWAALSGGRPSR
jgi:threonine/homoserine/homoserine lactone efflux protein